MNDQKMNLAFQIQNIIMRFELDLTFHTYRETSSYCIYDMLPMYSRIKDITKYEDEFQSLIGPETMLVPEKGFISIIVPKQNREIVPLVKILKDKFFGNCPGILKIALGENLKGGYVVGDLEKFIHILIAGESGSGKSLFLHTVIASLFYSCNTSILKFVLMDLNKSEFSVYENIAYLERPVVYNETQAKHALKWLIDEMKRRFDLFKNSGCRNIQSYNSKHHSIPYIVVIIDEFQNLTLRNKDIEKDIVELISQARKVGIHVILSTQKPSADIVTPLIKSNMPTRIAFSVPSHYDSQVILDEPGAEKLSKKGDMLLKDEDGLQRIQGAFISDDDIFYLVDNTEKIKFESLTYDDSIIEADYQEINEPGEFEKTYEEAVKYVTNTGKCNQWVLKQYLSRGNKIVNEILQRMKDEKVISQKKVGHDYEILKGDL